MDLSTVFRHQLGAWQGKDNICGGRQTSISQQSADTGEWYIVCARWPLQPVPQPCTLSFSQAACDASGNGSHAHSHIVYGAGGYTTVGEHQTNPRPERITLQMIAFHLQIAITPEEIAQHNGFRPTSSSSNRQPHVMILRDVCDFKRRSTRTVAALATSAYQWWPGGHGPGATEAAYSAVRASAEALPK